MYTYIYSLGCRFQLSKLYCTVLYWLCFRDKEVDFEDAKDSFAVDGKTIGVTTNINIADTDWASYGIDVVCCCTVSIFLIAPCFTP